MARGLNIFGKEGFLTDDERKKPLEHGCEFFTFKTCIDLSQPIQVIPYGSPKAGEYSFDAYSNDVAAFICWWTNNVMVDLNGFYGFGRKKFVFVGFKLV